MGEGCGHDELDIEAAGLSELETKSEPRHGEDNLRDELDSVEHPLDAHLNSTPIDCLSHCMRLMKLQGTACAAAL